MHPLAHKVTLIERKRMVADDVWVVGALGAGEDILEICALGAARLKRLIEDFYRDSIIRRRVARFEQPAACPLGHFLEEFIAACENFIWHRADV